MSSSGRAFEIERLLQREARPANGLAETESNALNVSYVILQSNYSEMVEFVAEGYDIGRTPVHVADTTEGDIEAQQAEATRLMHNYLSSLYSFNEHIKELVNRKTDDHVRMRSGQFLSIDQHRSDYSRKLTFLLGLRVDFQHGDFSGIYHQLYHEDDDEVLFHQKFSEDGFVDRTPLDDMGRYLQQTNPNEREYPFVFVSRFHNNELDSFYDDCLDWFDTAV